MNMTFRMADGTRAGIVPSRELREPAAKQLGVEWTRPDRTVPVVFHVRNQEALDRVLTRFGAAQHAC
ncbi:MAG TPA: hypothetical protein VFN94_09885 [Nitrospiria bacterium]|nr:hypothetical protein [Nitrospiria bacterium]